MLRPLGQLVLLAGLGLAPPTWADCPPAVRLEGDPDLVELVREDLGERSIDTTPRSSCAAVVARVWRRGATITVVIADSEGRTSQRTVERGAAAAALIESWLRRDLSRGLLIGFSSGGPPPVATVAAAAAPPALRIGVTVETALGGDAQLGIGLAGCVRLGPTCLGGLARFTFASDASDATLLGTADVPFTVGRWTPFVGVAAGLGWRTSSRLIGQPPQRISHSGTDLRLGLRGGAAYAIDRRLAVAATLSGELSPLVHAGEELGPEPEPHWRLRLGLGVIVGLP